MYDTDGRVSRAEIEEMMSAALDLEADRMSRQARSRSRTCVDQLVDLDDKKLLKSAPPPPDTGEDGANDAVEIEELDMPDDETPDIMHKPKSMHPTLNLTGQSQLQYIIKDAFGPAAVTKEAEGEGEGESATLKTHLTLHEFRKFTEENPVSMNILEQVCLLCGYDRVSLLLVCVPVTVPAAP